MGEGDPVTGVSSTPLSLEEYSRRARSITYAVWTGDPGAYRLSASSAFLDAVAWAKPGIYLRSPYIEAYFRRMGDIGYLCDDVEAMDGVIASILDAFPHERHERQRQAILRGRRLFEPGTLAPRLRAIAEASRGA